MRLPAENVNDRVVSGLAVLQRRQVANMEFACKRFGTTIPNSELMMSGDGPFFQTLRYYVKITFCLP